MESTDINMQVVVRSKVNDFDANRDSMVHWPNMGPIWGRHDPGGPQVGPMNFAIWECYSESLNQVCFGLLLPNSTP